MGTRNRGARLGSCDAPRGDDGEGGGPAVAYPAGTYWGV
jgi:hypothetical protein